MRARSAVAALLLLGAALPTTAAASPGSFPSGSNAAELVRNFWDLVGQGDPRHDVTTRAARRDDESAELAHPVSGTSCWEMLRMRPPAIQQATRDEPP